MENASKALIISGAVLTSILVVATGVQVYNSTGKGASEQSKQASEKMWEGVDLNMGMEGGSASVELPEGWEVTEKPAEWTSNKVTAIKEKATGKIVALPEGYSISEVAKEQTVAGGLVITDGANEFVWIPVSSDFSATYTSGDYSEPKYLKDTYYPPDVPWDSQAEIDYFYRTKADGTSYYTIDINSAGTNGIATNTTTSNGTTFDYGYHYNEMVESVNKYDGFYIGRYETTIDGSNVGSKENATILSSHIALAQTNNQPVRWWGLYAVQRNSNVKGNGNTVQTNMIWGQQWDAMIAYFNGVTPKIDYSETSVNILATSGKQASGQAKYKNGNSTISDEIYNIYDLRGNVFDCTAEAVDSDARSARGGSFYTPRNSASYRTGGHPSGYVSFDGSRLTLYIKQ